MSVKEYADVIGKVVYINYKNKSYFAIYTEKMGKKFRCKYVGFLPIKEGDVVIGVAEITQDPKFGTTLVFELPPFVILGTDKETILNSFLTALRNRSFGNMKAHQLYKILLKRYESEIGIVQALDQMASKFFYQKDDDYRELVIYSLICDEKKMLQLLQWWYKNRLLRNLYLLGLNNGDITRSNICPIELYQKCCDNPYAIKSLSLDKCDEICYRMGKEIKDSDKECGVIIRKIYDLMKNNGWIGVPSNMVLSMFPNIEKNLEDLKSSFNVETELHTIYLDSAYDAEVYIADMVKEMNSSKPMGFILDPSNLKFTDSSITEDQKEAVKTVFENNISIITGSAGTGKTRCIKEIVYNLERNGIQYKMASFTGKAVSRIREVTDKETPMTLHMMISKGGKDKSFNMLILDEASMITSDLLYEFRKKYDHDYRIVFIGDKNQLLPIGWGTLFSELIKSKKVATKYLTKVHRTDSNGILANANLIVEHMDPDYNGPPFEFEQSDNFEILEGNIETVKELLELLTGSGIPLDEITIISPFNRDLEVINKICSDKYNAKSKFVTDNRGKKWRVNDRVMMLENNYKANIMNGDEGKIINVNDCSVEVRFKNGIHTFNTQCSSEEDGVYKSLNCDMLQLCIGVSTHKFQGSERDYIIGYIPRGNLKSKFLNHNLLYTLITRAKKTIWLVGDVETMERAAVTRPPYRHDNLATRIRS